MTSMIFGTIYMGHQAYVAHRRQKQREKNYQRWEDLRDEYDEQKKISRDSRSLDIARPGPWDEQQQYERNGGYEYGPRDERPILTLRDQQECNDARLSWRPQEAWEPCHRASTDSLVSQNTSTSTLSSQYQQPQPQPQHPHLQHAATTPSAYWQHRGQLKPQKTGATWDDGLPAPLQVTRRSYDDYDHARRGSMPATVMPRQSQVDSLSQAPSRRGSAVPSRVGTPQPQSQPQSRAQSTFESQPVQIQSRHVPSANAHDDITAKLASISVNPVESHCPGGRMAELIERGY